MNKALLEKYKGEFFLVLMTLIWGGTFAIIKQSLDHASPVIFVAVRFSIAAVVMLPFAWKKLRVAKKSTIFAGMFLGALIFFAFSFQTLGLKYTSATKSGFITGSVVIIIPFLQTFIEKRFPTPGAIAGAILVFSGIVLISSPGDNLAGFIDELGSGFNIGDLFTVICALIFATHVVYLSVISKKHETTSLVFLQIIVTGALGLLAASVFNISGLEKLNFELSGILIFGLVYTSILATIITTTLQTKYQKVVTPTKAGIIYSLEPVFAAIIAFFALNEKISNFGYVGSLLIFAGILISELYDNLVANGRQTGKS
ncbi:MAG: permease [Melioribacteraceae bacterium]|nr:MAG: permease [Melioribacteraceae bacterium]